MIAETAVEFKVDGVRERLIEVGTVAGPCGATGDGRARGGRTPVSGNAGLGSSVARGLLETGGAGRFGRRSHVGRGTNRETLAGATRHDGC